MNYLKTLFITTILLSIGSFFGEEIAYTQETPSSLEKSINTVEPGSVTPSQETLVEDTIAIKETPKEEKSEEKTALQKWSAHLDKLTAVKTEQWDPANNIPDSSWTTEAMKLAKEALNKDNSIAESLKSGFFDAISKKIDQEDDAKFTDKTFALITEFNKAIDDQLTEIKEVEAAKTAAKTIVLEETKPEPFTEPITTPTENTPASTTAEDSTTQTATESTPQDLLKDWQNQLDKIKTTGTDYYETNTLFNDTYELAHKLLLAKLSNEQMIHNQFQAALDVRQFRKELYPIDITDFDVAIGIIEPEEQSSYVQQQNQTPAQQRAAAQQEKKMREAITKLRDEMAAKEALAKVDRKKEAEKQMIAQKALDLARERATAQQESSMQKLQLQYQQKLAQYEAKTRAETDAQLEKLRKELKITKATKKPETPQGILGTAIGAVKGAASAASKWWYGTTSSTTSLEEDKERLEKFNALLAVMPLTDNEKKLSVANWNTFIANLRSVPQLFDKTNLEANKKWIATIGQALEALIMRYHVISLPDAQGIVADILDESPNRTKIIKEIKNYLEGKKLKIIQEKQEKEAQFLKRTQEEEARKKIIMLENQKIKAEQERVEEDKRKKLLALTSYKDAKNQWNQLLAQLSENTKATAQENNAQMREAVKKSESLLNLASNIPSKNKPAISQKLKQKFTVALLEQQKPNKYKINIHQTMDQFNKAINTIEE